MRRDDTKSGSSSPASPNLSVKIVSFCILLASPFLLLWLTDRAFSFVHWRFSPDSFPSERELMMRNNLMPKGFLDDQKAFMEEMRSRKVKVAIFGGSSAAGYAAPLGFDRFLEAAAPDRLVIHNYAEGGAPFVGYQAELANVVLPYYDVIVIHAGHNEIWSYLYRRSRERNETLFTPWGSKVESQAADFRHSLKMMELKRLFNDDLLSGDASYLNRFRTAFWGALYNISNNSRLVYFIKSQGSKVMAGVSSGPIGETRLPFFQKSPFLGGEAKQHFLDDYRNAILEIKTRLRAEQKLVMASEVSNDLFPPLLDAVGEEASLPEAESKAASLYKALVTPGSTLAADEISALPGHAHKPYLKAVSCLGGLYPISAENRIEAACLDDARIARGADTLPVRVLPEILDFIRSLANSAENVRVVDSESLLGRARNQSDYLDFFVDFQHPSSFGHMTIANEILAILLPGEEIKFSPKSTECDAFTMHDSQGERTVTASKETFEQQVRTNIRWLDLFSRRSSAPFLYDFYKKRAEEKLGKCVAASAP